MTDQQPTKLSEPCVGSLDDPASSITAQLSAIFIAPVLAVLAIGNDQLDASFAEPLAQWVRVIGLIGDYPLRLLPGAAFGARDTDFCERGFRKTSFSRRGTFKPNSQRKTLTVDQYHPLRTLATLGFAHCGAPFLAGAKLPSRNVSSHCNRPSPSSAPSSVRQASSQTPALPTASADASKWPEKDIYRAEIATQRPSGAPTRCPPDRPGSRPKGGHDYPGAVSALATAARSASTAHPSTTQIASCPYKKLNKMQPSCESNQLEAEPIYETRSKHPHRYRPDAANGGRVSSSKRGSLSLSQS